MLSELQRLKGLAPDLKWEDCAVLASVHSRLDSVRATLEQAGVPVRVRIGREHSYSLFRLREVQDFLEAVQNHPASELDGPQLRAILATLSERRPGEQGFELVKRTLDSFTRDAGEQHQSKLQLREFFGELLVEQRREQTFGEGVLLGTVHGSKGAEFDHVLILDGDWRPREGRQEEEQRRLYYVGMTRARLTLTLFHGCSRCAPWLRELGGDTFHRSPPTEARVAHPAASTVHELVGLGDLYLGFSARSHQHERIEAAVAGLRTGSALLLRDTPKRIQITDAHGEPVGALSEGASKRWRPLLPLILDVKVAAVLVRRRTDEKEEFRTQLKREAWSVVVPEVRYARHPD